MGNMGMKTMGLVALSSCSMDWSWVHAARDEN